MKNVVERKIAWGDLDALGIVFYPRYSEWIDACGHLFFEAVGLGMDRLWQDRGLLFGLVETRCTFHRSGRYHQTVRITTRLSRIGTKSLTLLHTIEEAETGTLLLEGSETRACLDVSDPRDLHAVLIPKDLRETLERAFTTPD